LSSPEQAPIQANDAASDMRIRNVRIAKPAPLRGSVPPTLLRARWTARGFLSHRSVWVQRKFEMARLRS
jgi:hypothetical protein